jgi:hypothetical protein
MRRLGVGLCSGPEVTSGVIGVGGAKRGGYSAAKDEERSCDKEYENKNAWRTHLERQWINERSPKGEWRRRRKEQERRSRRRSVKWKEKERLVS